MTQPVSSWAVSGEAKPHSRASNSFATAPKSSLRLPGRMRQHVTPAAAAAAHVEHHRLGRLVGPVAADDADRLERPSASCSMTRNFALARPGASPAGRTRQRPRMTFSDRSLSASSRSAPCRRRRDVRRRRCDGGCARSSRSSADRRRSRAGSGRPGPSPPSAHRHARCGSAPAWR